ncbi:cytochrome c oxidase assembly protein CtaG/Cox11-domain-containing protein [Paraphysoderma sedebokerense]|nr:cytochrome c oxidase assembly protein CtaG/Cox11-domain-containing protein [Paraphysoderma sedebokerense]
MADPTSRVDIDEMAFVCLLFRSPRECVEQLTRHHSLSNFFKTPTTFTYYSRNPILPANVKMPRTYSSSTSQASRNTNSLYYMSAVLVFGLGLTYTAVPLYRMFCAATGFASSSTHDSSRFSSSNMIPMESHRRLRITFNADTSRSLPWSFSPTQRSVYVIPGETALAFYTAKNNSDKDVIGISTYNVTPGKAGMYFNKIQCFCFEEQKLKAGEEVDMPVFFFIDPEFAMDPAMDDVDTITLSYTFFNAKTVDK